jgi:membrane-anchored mycosin MYCP
MGKDGRVADFSIRGPWVTVAGLAALVRERFPNLSAKQVMYRSMSTASHEAVSDGGRDNLVGYGMINPVSSC